ncbi:outer membrane beta-barrel protein [Fulvimonas yonginensis]|uniref:Outer membrane beta-barrel protein n=1 Tax=Fulvimonas yonginensis TaxID=1495200 RepID=A0ABU8JBE4_9GAMM
MNKLLTAALGAALAVASASAAAADGNGNGNGAFFINAGVGQAQYHVGRTDGLGYALDDKDTAGALRFGYMWHASQAFDLGIEGGYVDLGKVTADYNDGTYVAHADLGATGWMLGINGKYGFASHWYVSARGGWLRSKGDLKASAYDNSTHQGGYLSGNGDGDGWYGGVGVGYDFAPSFSMGLNYDNYHAKAAQDGVSVHGNIGTYMVSAEYRF